MAILSALEHLRLADPAPLIRCGTFAVGMAAVAVLLAGRLRLGGVSPAMLVRCGSPAVVMCLLMLVLAVGSILSEWSLSQEAVLAGVFSLVLLSVLGVTEHQLTSDKPASVAGAQPLASIKPQESENRAAA